MDLLERAKQKLEDSKKGSEVKIIPGIEKIPEVQKSKASKKPKLKISTDRDANKKQLLNRITNTLEKEIDRIPIEVFRSFDLFFREIKER